MLILLYLWIQLLHTFYITIAWCVARLCLGKMVRFDQYYEYQNNFCAGLKRQSESLFLKGSHVPITITVILCPHSFIAVSGYYFGV